MIDLMKARLWIASVTFLAFFASSSAAYADSLELLQKGRQLQSKGNYKDAQDCYLQALTEEPANLSVQDALVEVCQSQVHDKSDNPAAHIDLGNAFAYSGRMREAMAEFKTALQLSPDHRNTEASRLLQLANPQTIIGNSHSAEAWSKLLKQKPELICPTCGSRANSLLPVIIGKPDAEQKESINHGTAYLATAKVQPEDLPQWYCVNCRHQFASAGERRVDVDFGPYMADLQRRIKRAWFPPKGHESDNVTVVFNVGRNGQLSDLSVEKSSGVEISDQAALTAVQNAAPFRRLPEFATAPVRVSFKFDYNVFTGGGGGAFRKF